MKPLDRPTDTEIRRALADVLSGTAFARSERLRAFLSYVVTKDLAGQAMQLKGYTIAVDVFRRPDAFNADSDPLVRVHAGKLRKLLAAYYEAEGKDAVWQIDIPKGGYAPIYLRRPPMANVPEAMDPETSVEMVSAAAIVEMAPREAEPVEIVNEATPADVLDESAVSEAPPATASARARSRLSITRRARPSWLPAPLASPVAMISLLPLLLFVPLSSTALGVSPQVQARFSISTMANDIDLPRVTVRSDGEQTSLAAQLAGQIRGAMDYYTVIIPVSKPRIPASPPPSKSPLAFTISISPAETDSQTRVTVSSDATGDIVSQIWIDNENLSNDFDLLFESLGIAARTLATNGDLFHYAVDKGISSPLMQCMLITDTYRREKSRDALKQARLCQEKLLGKRKNEREFVISASELKRNVHP
ncbi:hypothetical protein [Rhizobium sp. PP-CC-3G-465]|uniref:hypothetical protein n=1 Tax=Rhizobium sp. PP-CC-3G-465 TaxID=2135648 RepID=UPI00105388F7|nr:hypothetical protein C8J33_101511 [Rhizobium sp. PP-CC-3G-465]